MNWYSFVIGLCYVKQGLAMSLYTSKLSIFFNQANHSDTVKKTILSTSPLPLKWLKRLRIFMNGNNLD